jgi:signal transduction histidine kinase/DNA-binding response OmpR family regulator
MTRPQILIVDDNPDNILALEAILCDLPATTKSVHSGDEALLSLLIGDFAVLLLDVNMPHLDGFETARLVRSRDRTRHLPIIFLTAYSRSETNVAEAYSLGAVDFIQKPIMPEILRAKVSVFLELWKKGEESKRQAELLRQSEQREHARKMERARQELEKKWFERANERLQFLSEAATRLLLEAPEQNISPILARLIDHFGIDVQLEYRLDDDQNHVLLSGEAGLDEPVPNEIGRLSIFGNIIGRVAREHVRYVESDLEQPPELDDPLEEHLGVRTIACFPIATAQRLHRIVVLGSRQKKLLGTDEVASIQLLCDQMAAALDRAQLVTELREAHQRKDEFLAMLGHELRNPLAPIMNSLDLFRKRVGTDAVVQRALVASERQVRHIVRLVDDLLDVSRITRGKVALKKERIELSTVIEQVRHACEYIIEERHHHLTISLPSEQLFIDADPNRLAQVLANLLHNAAKYTEPGGEITLAAEVRGEQLAISVKDNGIGIPPQMLDKIFDVFVQVEPTADRSRGGLGLGLSLVRHLIQMHNGTVDVQSAGAGLGSEFTVKLPLVAQITRDLEVQKVVELERPIRELSIVLIEDNADIRETLRDILELRGHTVAVAKDGYDGVKKVLAVLPDIALVDIGLPGFDGYQVADAIRRSDLGKNIRLVALTGYGALDDRRRALDAGFDEHLVKPLSPEQLERTLSNLCRSASGTTDLYNPAIPATTGTRLDANAEQQR